MPKKPSNILICAGLILAMALVQIAFYQPSEPFFNNDETRHVMTGVFFSDLFYDLPIENLRDYTIRYYLQYPALGLLVWPPLFYFVEGLFMFVFGTSLIVSKILVGLFSVMGCIYLFLLVLRTHNMTIAALSVLIFGFSPLYFLFSRQVMLEVASLAFGLATIYHFFRYLELERRRDIIVAALTFACTALTRYTGLYILPVLMIMMIVYKQVQILRRREFLLAAVLAVLLISPFYTLSAVEFAWVQVKRSTEGVAVGSSEFMALSNFLYYPSELPNQIGWFALIPAIIGLLYGLTRMQRKNSWPYFAMIGVTYCMFSPLAELKSRYVIYWLPAFAFFSALGIFWLLNNIKVQTVRFSIGIIVISGTMWSSLREPRFFVKGYERAAQYVFSNTEHSTFCVFDGYLEGNFIYQIRRIDRDRRLWILRGDKLFYSVIVDPGTAYEEFVKTEQDILTTIYKYDPEFIVLEEPQIVFQMSMADTLRAVIKRHPERFRLEKKIPIQSNYAQFADVRLKIYRNIYRNSHPEEDLKIEMLGLRRTIQTPIPRGARRSGY